jgi:hypothetical protein
VAARLFQACSSAADAQHIYWYSIYVAFPVECDIPPPHTGADGHITIPVQWKATYLYHWFQWCTKAYFGTWATAYQSDFPKKQRDLTQWLSSGTCVASFHIRFTISPRDWDLSSGDIRESESRWLNVCIVCLYKAKPMLVREWWVFYALHDNRELV